MAFVNEYISNENIERFQIDELMNNYRVEEWHRGPKPFPNNHYTHRWTIDEERESWFMWVHDPHKPDHREGYTGERIFILNYKGKRVEVVLRKVFKESSRKLTDNPFNIVWMLDRIAPEFIEELTNEEIIELVKEALGVYGIDGLKTPVPFEHIVVTCKF